MSTTGRFVAASAAADERGVQVGLLCESNESDVSIRQEAGRFQAGRGHYCGAHTLWNVGIDDRGNLYKCWEAVDKPHLSFGTAHDWDPVNPLETATNPDHLTSYLSTAIPVPDDCRPVRVRHAWDDFPDCNLVNGEGLPCGPFEFGLE